MQKPLNKFVQNLLHRITKGEEKNSDDFDFNILL